MLCGWYVSADKMTLTGMFHRITLCARLTLVQITTAAAFKVCDFSSQHTRQGSNYKQHAKTCETDDM